MIKEVRELRGDLYVISRTFTRVVVTPATTAAASAATAAAESAAATEASGAASTARASATSLSPLPSLPLPARPLATGSLPAQSLIIALILTVRLRVIRLWTCAALRQSSTAFAQAEGLGDRQIEIERTGIHCANSVRIIRLEKIAQQHRRLRGPAVRDARIGDQRVETRGKIGVAIDACRSIVDNGVEVVVTAGRDIERPTR